MPRDLRSLKAHLTVHYYDPYVHQPFDFDNPPPSPRFSLAHLDEQLNEFIRNFIPANCTAFSSVTCDKSMADYGVLKVNDLKKLLQERNLSTTGNKPDLIKRLQDADRDAEANGSAAAAPAAAPNNAVAEDEDAINYEDDDEPAAAPAAPAAAPPVAAEPTPAAPEDTVANPADETVAPTTEEASPTPAAPVFTANLPDTDPDSEAAKRLARAKRFGIPEESLEAQKAARATRFGLEKEDLAKSLDAPLPERQKKRARGAEDALADKEGSPAAKKVANGAGGGGRDGGGRQRNGGGRGRGGRNGERGGSAAQGGQNKNQRPKQDGGAKRAAAAPVAMDPAEKAKLEARAKRFAS
ncbi:hypothetical protein CONLIGDRAFT_343569 [Coniochaeta ligniaria NRRL 30616]|uniref:SAP domain-containing protein n=1 Tax=Coniochaeta ligniaria NRRL 30616 TaxID=1408157 RepID=A0A1J7J8X9_9PEZI|nr:hypothetical protein CONLIGDRAFT_343569 [Coniochaeta ligniaria NRRL 30616]